MPQSEDRFSSARRIYGDKALARFAAAHVTVCGIGGVGSWACEALARSGIGSLTLIDADDITGSNINRQLHALESTIGQAKVDAMRQRLVDINPELQCHVIDDMLVTRNIPKLIPTTTDFVIDAIDSVRFKADLIVHCKRQKIAIVTAGGAGGLTDPTRVGIADLTRTVNDPLASKVRKRLRQHYDWSSNPARRFGVKCVFSDESPKYPDGQGGVSSERPNNKGVTLDCDTGYGSAVTVTAVFGFTLAAHVLERLADES